MKLDPFFAFFRDERETSSRFLLRPNIGPIKQYRNASCVILPPPQEITIRLDQALTHRTSANDFSHTTITSQTLSDFLYWSFGEISERSTAGSVYKKLAKTHPSGGAKYPLELYLLIQRSTGIAPGLYHYRPDVHRLEFISRVSAEQHRAIRSGCGYALFQSTPVLVCFTYLKERNQPKYGALGYKLGILEAGHVSQTMYLLAAALNLRVCAIGGLFEELFHSLADCDGLNEALFYALALGQVEEERDK